MGSGEVARRKVVNRVAGSLTYEFKDFESYLVKANSHHLGGLACFDCNGTGKKLPEGARPDPVEGYKLVDRVSCFTCRGSGRCALEKHRENWRKLFLQERMKNKKTKEKRDKLWSALNKLTIDEIKILGLY